MDTNYLPDDPQELKSIIIDYQNQISHLEEKIDFLQRAIFGAKSEKRCDIQTPEKHLLLPGFEEQVLEDIKPQKITVPEHTRKKRGRKPLPPELPRDKIIHDLPEEEKTCACGTAMNCIGQEVSEKLHYVPAQLRVEQHIRYKYACRECEGVESDQGAVVTAPMPAQLIPQGIATPSLLAHILVAKFVDALPFYRQEKQFARLGVELSRSTMVSWAMSVAKACEPFIGLFKEELLAEHFLGIDETTVQVLSEEDRANTTKSYMWVFLGGSPERPTVYYEYHPTRSGSALEFLQDFTGYIQTDGYVCYEALGEQPGITHVGCLAHVRRKFMDVLKMSKREKAKGGTAQEIIDLIGQIYDLEKALAQQKLEPDRIKEHREEYVVPILDKIKAILDQRSLTTPPKSQLGRAISYALNQWERVVRYTEDGRLRPDNNLVENAIRPFALGRKNWLFAGHPNGAKAGALFFSLIETAKMNNLEPYAYLRYLFEQLPLAQSEEDLKRLMPQHIDPALIPAPSAS
jgi:transposase